MIEIKFRAWDKQDKIMWLPLTLDDLIEGRWELETENQEHSLPHKDYLDFAHKDTIWMQYTGLKDEAGKEIYKSDIIEYAYYHPITGKQVYRNEIVFNEGKACWCAEYMDGEYHYFGEIIFKQACHVIGNIYESPELINQSKEDGK